MSDDTIDAVICDMVEIIRSKSADEDEKDAAKVTLIEALGLHPTLTDTERDEIEDMISDYHYSAEFKEKRCHWGSAAKARRRAVTLRGLLERLGGKS